MKLKNSFADKTFVEMFITGIALHNLYHILLRDFFEPPFKKETIQFILRQRQRRNISKKNRKTHLERCYLWDQPKLDRKCKQFLISTPTSSRKKNLKSHFHFIYIFRLFSSWTRQENAISYPDLLDITPLWLSLRRNFFSSKIFAQSLHKQTCIQISPISWIHLPLIFIHICILGNKW